MFALDQKLVLIHILVIISLVFRWFWMWGIPGAILSMPMSAITNHCESSSASGCIWPLP